MECFCRVGSVCMAICVNVERMYAVVFPLKTVGWRRYMLPVCLAVATLYNIPKVNKGCHAYYNVKERF